MADRSRLKKAAMPLSISKPGISPLPVKRHEALPEAIANRVAEAIAARQLAAGQRIVETTLATQLNVSRVPVREALKVLHTQGIISGGGHRGFRVASFSEKMVRSVQEARIELETLILRDAILAWRDGTSDVKELDEAIGVMRSAARGGDFREMLRADIAFHATICEAAYNPIFATLWQAIARHLLIILNLARFRDIDLRVVVRRHQALRDQIIGLIANPDRVDDVRGILVAHFLAERQAHGLGAPFPAE
jgi:DNA-binding GntR family transcriptional regulator